MCGRNVLLHDVGNSLAISMKCAIKIYPNVLCIINAVLVMKVIKLTT